MMPPPVGAPPSMPPMTPPVGAKNVASLVPAEWRTRGAGSAYLTAGEERTREAALKAAT